MNIAEEAQNDPAIALARAAIAREIEAEFHDIPNAHRDGLRAADRIIHLLRQGQKR